MEKQIDINKFSREIRLAWQNKYPDGAYPDEGAIRRLAETTGYDIEYCKDVLSGMPEKDKRDAVPGFPLFIRYCKEGWNNGTDTKILPKEYYFDTKTGKSYLLHTDSNGKRYYNVPVVTSKFRQMMERGFILDPQYESPLGKSREYLYDWLEKQFDYLFKSGQIDEKVYEQGLVGIELWKGTIDIDLHFNKQEDLSLADIIGG